jgi:O-antigen ligase
MSTRAQILRRFAQPGTRLSNTNNLVAWASASLFMLLLAVFVGVTIAEAQWLYLGLGIALCVAMVWPIEAALGFYAFLLPFQSIAVLGQGRTGTTANWVLGAVAALALFGAGALRGRLSWPKSNTKWWLAFFLWASATCLWALDPSTATAKLPTAGALLLLYFAGCFWRATPKEMAVLSWAIVLGGAAASLVAVRGFMSGITYSSLRYGATDRASLVLGGREADPNLFAADLLLPLALAIAVCFSSSSRKWKLTAFLCAGLIVYAILITMSRGALLSVVVLLFVYAVRLHLSRKIILLGAGLMALLLAVPSVFFSRLQEAVPTGGAGRLEIWRSGLVAFEHYFLTGAGLANFPIAYSHFAGSARKFVGYTRASHNIYLNVAVELGIIGVILLGSALFAELRALKRFRLTFDRPPMPIVAVEAATYAMLLAAMFLDVLWSKSFWLLWMVLAMFLRSYATETSVPSIEPARSRPWLN